jgi:tRNA pseudouridine65 synthase
MIPLDILYQDEFLVAIDKPAGMLVHPGREPEGTEWIAMKRLRDQLDHHVFPVHRLDRPTSGVLLFALDKHTAGLVQQAFELRQVQKTYHAIVIGLTPSAWVIDSPLRADPSAAALAAKTTFRRLGFRSGCIALGPQAADLSWIEATPETGRFHQIRRHLLETGFPVVGDFRYAGEERSHALGQTLGIGTRMLLQSKALELIHPYEGSLLRIEAPTDREFVQFLPMLS